MVKKIKSNLNVLELMIFYWESVLSKDKIPESYLYEIAQKEEMQYLYTKEGFSEDSVRKVLSAISNREILSEKTKTEFKFWNYNMWVLEDMELTKAMINPVKTLNLDGFIDELQEDCPYEELEIIFIPGHEETYYIDKNKLIINFFKIQVSLWEDGIKIENQDFKEFILSKIKEICE